MDQLALAITRQQVCYDDDGQGGGEDQRDRISTSNLGRR
jgi:hypothetical protein